MVFDKLGRRREEIISAIEPRAPDRPNGRDNDEGAADGDVRPTQDLMPHQLRFARTAACSASRNARNASRAAGLPASRFRADS